jgi:hypothetical protein
MTNSRAGKAEKRLVRSLDRRLHVVDIENLAGTGRPEPGPVAQLHAAYEAAVGVAEQDHVVVACNPGCLIDVGTGWGLRCARFKTGRGCNGADWELLEVLESEGVAERFTEVVIGSGDGIFAPTVARLASVGCAVTVVSRRRSLSAKLALAARQIVYLPDVEALAGPVAPALRVVA